MVAAAGLNPRRRFARFELSKLLRMISSYRPDFGAGATRSFCSRHDEGTVGRRLV
jgi:hypothetical protein